MTLLLVLLWTLLGVAQPVNRYEVLGVAENATTAEIARAFKILAVKHHPDKQRDSAASHDYFMQLAEAHSVLKDKRAAFDEELRFFREHGRVWWQVRYRVVSRSNFAANVWVVIAVAGELQLECVVF
jgi:curved DNA-binding protein CbpA